MNWQQLLGFKNLRGKIPCHQNGGKPQQALDFLNDSAERAHHQGEQASRSAGRLRQEHYGVDESQLWGYGLFCRQEQHLFLGQ
ncbi:hypothetical protein ACNKHW_22230 [Shigella flexneri]